MLKLKKLEAPQDDLLDVKRLAYEVLVYSAAKFGVPQNCLPQWPGRDTYPGYGRLVRVLSRMAFKYQITQRKSWSCEFNTFFLLSRFRSWSDTQYVLWEMFRATIQWAGCIRHKMLIGLAVMNEFLLFLYSKNFSLHVAELAEFYEWYMSTDWPKLEKFRKKSEECNSFAEFLSIYQRNAGHWEEFENVGGLAEIYRRLLHPKFDFVDMFYNEFIPEFCIPYHNEDKLPHLSYTFYDKSVAFFRKMTKNLSRKHRRECSDVFNATVWRDCRICPRIDLIRDYEPRLGLCIPFAPEVFLSVVYKIPKTELWKLKPETAEPLLPLYDRWLQDHGVDMKFELYVRPFQNLPDTSQQADGSQRISPGQERGQKTRSSSPTLHTGPSEIEPFRWNKTFFHPGSNPDTEASRPKREGHRRRLFSEGAIRKSGFDIFKLFPRKDYSLGHNLKPLETKSEESVQGADVSVVDTATSSQKRPGKSPKAEDGKGSNSPEEQEASESSSLLSLEKGIAQCDLGPSETISCSPKPENIGLETLSSEESLRDADVSVVDAATSSQNRPGARPEEATASIKPISPDSFLAEEFAQINLGPSETISCSPKPENIGLDARSSEESLRDANVSVVDAATSPQNRPGTSPKEVAGDGKGSIRPEEPTRAENSEELKFGFSTWSYNSETCFHPGSNPDAEASRQEKAGHRRRLSSEVAIRKMGYASYSGNDDRLEQYLKPLEKRTRRKSIRDAYASVFDAATSSQNLPVTSLEEATDLDASEVDAATSSQNRPGARLEEATDPGASEVDAATSSQNRPGARSEEATDLDASEVDAATSSQNRPDARLEEATDRRKPISPDSFLAEGFAQINLGPSETESSNEESN